MKVLETNRLLLRKPKETDVDDILFIRNSEFVLQYNAMSNISRDEMLESIQKNSDNSIYLFHKVEEKVIGAIFIQNDDLRYKVNSVCLAYYLGEKHANNGYMYEALREVIKHLFEQGIDVISARTFTENIASFQLLKKLGFVHEGTIQRAVLGYNDIVYDDHILSIIKEEMK
ncbi:MAG: GNAT family N-acetyltransferase [Bacilli bacterium]|nr:GNAT family N-acetyltransferase [Bacilli bacterium]